MSIRERANKIKDKRCKNLIAVLENPKNLENVGSVVRNIDALGVEKLYIVDGSHLLPESWQRMRDKRTLNKISASAIRWTFVKTFPDTKSCLEYLKKKNFVSIVTSPHLKGRENVPLDKGVYTQKKLAVWFGNESQGVSQEAIDNSKFCVNIDMNGIIESLNLGTSTGIVLYEVTRQRRNFKEKKI